VGDLGVPVFTLKGTRREHATKTGTPNFPLASKFLFSSHIITRYLIFFVVIVWKESNIKIVPLTLITDH